jgi:CBS domain containing-hemolysin-like protein
MFAFQLISNEIFALKPIDLASDALLFMDDWQIRDLPIVQNQKVLGQVNYKTLLSNKGKKMAALTLEKALFCSENTHIYDIIKAFIQSESTAITVVDQQQNFKGIIAAKDLAKLVFSNASIHQEGGIIVLQMPAHDYSLSEIARISEINNAKIIYTHVASLQDSENSVQVSLKYNVVDLKHIIATFQRYEYSIVFSTQSADLEEITNKKFDWLIKYLNT